MYKYLFLLLFISCASTTLDSCKGKVGPDADKCIEETKLRQHFLNRNREFSSIKRNISTHNVRMVGMSFVPSKLNVKKGDKVVWTNETTTLHNVVSEDSKIRSKLLKKGQKFEVIVEKSFKYYCAPHKAMGMKGEITVE